MEIKVVRKVLSVNDAIATEIKKALKAKRIFMINVMSSPGSGKTTLLSKTINALKKDFQIGVVVGDICTTRDSERLSETGVPVVQINTEPFGGDCHLAANVIQEALSQLELSRLNLVIIENVGNLVCPAEFDVGEDKKIVLLSLPEGDDKPLKYPLMFRVSNAAIINKIDLAPHLEIDKAQFVKNIKKVNPEIPVFELSAKTGQGMDAWLNWLKKEAETKISSQS